MDRILFIIPPYVDFANFTRPAFNERVVTKKSGVYGSVVTDMPLGLLSISAYLKANSEVEIRLIDFNIILNKIDYFHHGSFLELMREELSKKQWRRFSPTIIGISTLFTPAYTNMLGAAEAARQAHPSSLIIAGGGVPTNMYREIFRDSTSIDALCYGEGELPLLKLLRSTDKNGLLDSSPSWITRDKVKNRCCYDYDFITNLDEIPFYDYDLICPEDYSMNPTISTIVAFENTKSSKSLFHVATSRGCPHRCCYCASHTVHGRRMRYHSAERIIGDLKHLKSRYNAKLIGVQDDNFMIDKDRALQIIEAAKELNMRLFFQSGLPLYALDRKTLEAIRDTGSKELVLPIESGSDRVLKDIMHKPLELSIVRRVISDCRDLGIDTDANILIGLPGETKQDIEDTRAFLKTLDATWFRIYVATPLVGSEMLDTCIKNNYLKGSYIGCDFKKAVVETPDFTAEYIQEKAYALNLELNFVENSDMRLGNYAAALKGFENTIRVKSDHAFACYFAARCCKLLKRNEKYREYKTRYREIVERSEFWSNQVSIFNLAKLD